MEYLSYYLGQHKNKNILYFLDCESDYNSLLFCLDISSYNSFIVVFKNEEEARKYKENNDADFEYKTLDDDLSNYSDYSFVIDHFTHINEITKYKPKEVVGFFEYKTNTFEIWEELRLVCKHISLARDCGPYRNEVLSWTKEENNDIELSVILPVYNVAKYLDKCIKTVCAWEAPYVEFLFVNDGSPDNSREIILEYAKKDPRIKLLDKENGGCASAREYGFAKAKGRYLGLIDPDDFIDPDMYKKLLSRAMVGTYDIAYCGYNEYYENTKQSKEVKEPYNPVFEFGTSDRRTIDTLIAYQRIAIWREIFKRDFIRENDLHFHVDIKRHDDLPFKIETYAKAKSVVMVNKPMYYYRLGREGQDVSATDNRLYVHFDIFKHIDEFFEKNHNCRQEDYYYIAKIQTYHWVVTKIDADIVSDFLKKAADDLKIKNTKDGWKKVLKTAFKTKEVNLFFGCLKKKQAKYL